MRIAVLDLTFQPEEQFNGIATVGQILIDWLAPAFPEARFNEVPIAYGSDFPATEDFDGALLSGSEVGVYDDTPWMRPLRAFIETARDAGKPMFGICFGHQIMADVLGGKAEKSSAGNHVGVRSYDLEGEEVQAYAWHQDQVTRVPPGARVTATAGYCPVGALEYDIPAMSVQFHPEYNEPRLQEVWDILADELDAGDIASARASLDGAEVSQSLMARQAAEFFRKHRA